MTGDQVDADSLLLRAEGARICASPEFSRAPVMRRLLMFLVDETTAGRGDDLKAYGVAVDGLGRPSDFDSQSDSYPRVQVGRLRRVIDQYYQKYGVGPDGGRLALRSGSYRVHWEPAPLSSAPVLEDVSVASDTPDTGKARRGVSTAGLRRAGLMLLAALAILALMIFSGWAALQMHDRRAPSMAAEAEHLPIPSPDIVIEPIRAVDQADPQLAERITRIFADALPRGWMLTVRSADSLAPVTGYRLTGTLVGGERKLLYLALRDVGSHTQIWSQRIDAGVAESTLRTRLNPTIATLMSPFGVIGARERRRGAGDYRAGFPCMMRYAAYYASADPQEEKPVNQCLAKTLRLEPGYGPAMAAQVVLLGRAGMRHPEDADALRRQALTLARKAVDVDPYSSDAQLALGTAAYNQGLCDQGRTSVTRALELNPYDAYAQGRAGLQMFQCDDPAYQRHLELAWQLDPALPGIMAMPIIIAMAERGDGQAALRFAQKLSAREGSGKAAYAITMTVAYAGAQDMTGARARWRDAAVASGTDPAAAPDAILRRIIAYPGLAKRTEAYLRGRGVFG